MAKLAKSTALKPAPKKGAAKVAPKKPAKTRGGESALQSKKKKPARNDSDNLALKPKTELFMTAISTFAGEDTFYEGGQARIDRVKELTATVTEKDPEWLQRFIPWLRGPEVNIRTISMIIAAEYIANEGPNGRTVINSVCQRAEEPAEILSYWMDQYYGWEKKTFPIKSPKLPSALRKGIADACIRLYTQYAVLKYDGGASKLGMSQILNLVHPSVKDFPKDWSSARIEEQRSIFQWISDQMYGNETPLAYIPLIDAQMALRELDRDEVLALTSEQLNAAGITWEQMGGLLQGGWTAKAWEALIPNMGYMALLRNLRNFDAAGISRAYSTKVIDILTDPDRVSKSRQLPFRFLNAYKNTNSDTYSAALGEALDLSCKNIPSFPGSTLILVDKSSSMNRLPSATTMAKNYRADGNYTRMWEMGALFAIALWKKQANADVVIFGDSSKVIHIPNGTSVLRGIELLRPNNGVGHGTNIWGTARERYDRHNRIVIFSDMQGNVAQSDARRLSHVPFIHAYDLLGYGKGLPFQTGVDNRYQYGGFSDSSFKLMALLESSDAGWPF